MAAAASIMAMKVRKKAQKEKELAMANSLDGEERKLILTQLRYDDELVFLADIAEGTLPAESAHEGGRRKSGTMGEGGFIDGEEEEVAAWDDYGTGFPGTRPHYLSERHFELMKKSVGIKAMEDKSELFNAYAKAPPPADVVFQAEVEASERLIAEEEAKAAAAAAPNGGRKSSPRGCAASPVAAGEPKAPLFDFAGAPQHVIWYNEFVLANQLVVANEEFNFLIVFCIVLAGILVGVQSYPENVGNPVIGTMDLVIQVIFSCECVFKLWAEGVRPLRYFAGPEWGWNNFDFWLVFICWVPVGGNVAFLRLLRLMRLMKLVGKVKQLQVIVMGLAKGLGSVTYIMILMLLIFYLFAVLGVGSFRKNDPFHFGSLGIAMVTLFRCATLEDWTDVMYINMFGCASQYTGVDGLYHGADGGSAWGDDGGGGGPGVRDAIMKTKAGEFYSYECWHSTAQPMLATVFFIFFILIAAFVMLSLFVGAVCGGMSEALEAFKAQEAEEAAARTARERAAAAAEEEAAGTGYSLAALRGAFGAVDGDGSGQIDAAELCRAMAAMGEHGITVDVAEAFIGALDKDDNHTMGFDEFVDMMTGGELEASFTEEEIAEEEAQHAEAQRRASGVAAEKAEGGGALTSAEESERVLSGLKSLAKDLVVDPAEMARQQKEAMALVGMIRRAWKCESKSAVGVDSIEGEYAQRYFALSLQALALSEKPWFVNLITGTICVAGGLVGVQTELAYPGNPGIPPALDVLDNIILAIFTVEIVVKFLAEGFAPMRYFIDHWNKFDFFIVAACYLFMIPLLPDVGSMLAMLRLLRLLRVLKLVKALPELRIIIEALISGFGSISFVTIILFMFFYLFANIGMIFFGKNDPMHFGRLQFALLSLFRVATLDDWTDIMYLNMFGCDSWEYGYGAPDLGFGSEAQPGNQFHRINCTDPEAWGWIAGVYFLLFVILGSLVLLTLFIGIVATSMEEAKHEQKNDAKRDAAVAMRCAALDIESATHLELYRSVFQELDKHGDGKLDRNAMKPLIEVLPLIHMTGLASNGQQVQDAKAAVAAAKDAKGGAANGGANGGAQTTTGGDVREECKAEEIQVVLLGGGGGEGEGEGGEGEGEDGDDRKDNMVTKVDIEQLVQIVDSKFKGAVEFPDFVVILDFMRRVDASPGLLHRLREACRAVRDRNTAAGAAELKEELSLLGEAPAELPGSPADAAAVREEAAALAEAHRAARAGVDAALLRLAQPDPQLEADLALEAIGLNALGDGHGGGHGDGHGGGGGGPGDPLARSPSGFVPKASVDSALAEVASAGPLRGVSVSEVEGTYAAMAQALRLRHEIVSLHALANDLDALEHQRAEALKRKCDVLSSRLARRTDLVMRRRTTDGGTSFDGGGGGGPQRPPKDVGGSSGAGRAVAAPVGANKTNGSLFSAPPNRGGKVHPEEMQVREIRTPSRERGGGDASPVPEV